MSKPVATAPLPASDIERVRAFNRAYTQAFGFLNDRLDKSRFPLTDARILYEIANGDGLTAADIERKLGMDKAQISRSVTRLTQQGFVTATPSQSHAKHLILALTEQGRAAFDALFRKTQQAVAGHLGKIAPDQRARLIAAMGEIVDILGQRADEAPEWTVRSFRVGDLGWIVHRQACLYAEQYGWDGSYETLIARILADFVDDFDPSREQAWVAERHGRTVGSIFLVKTERPDLAKLRLLYVEPSARGLGIGRGLVDRCIAAARGKGYARLELWTNDVLAPARRIYEAAGFTLVEENAHRSFGHDLVGQTWGLDL